MTRESQGVINSRRKRRILENREFHALQTHISFPTDLPKEGPHIDGGRPRYTPGDSVRVNCTSSRSRPAATLAWFINGEPAEEANLHRYPPVRDEDGLETSILGLEFRVRHKHFRKGDLKMKCLATIAQLYWRSNEESVEGDRPQKAPALESRETLNPGKREASSHSSSSGGVSWTMNGSSSFISSSRSLSFVLVASVALLLNNLCLGRTTLWGSLIMNITR
ncbi:unnamed protein product [Allacma fusca]|uniref:CD80-like immunoglobulin C2-set domain-containing protein n=1 Tax=Allacma fusca TaxID=39272 RepID=A0A8J2KJG4_9HEXA|nr:unnamed protein product [Allacma fusca]